MSVRRLISKDCRGTPGHEPDAGGVTSSPIFIDLLVFRPVAAGSPKESASRLLAEGALYDDASCLSATEKHISAISMVSIDQA